MPRPKGCTCGTPKPCKIHGATVPGVGDAAPVGGAGSEQDGAPELPRDKPRRRGPDMAPKPRSRARKPTPPDAPDDAALVETLSQLLTMPAVPAALVLDCDYCRDHFIVEGPRAARELVALSLTNPALRGALESLHGAITKLTIAGVLAAYVGKPMLHHVAPERILTAAGPVVGVPPRPVKPKHFHDGDPQAQRNGSAGPASEDQHSGAQAA